VKGAGAVILGLYLMVASSFCIIFLYSIPNAIAEAAVNREHSFQRAKFGNGCEDEDVIAYYFEAGDSQNKPIRRGFAIASSNDYVALSRRRTFPSDIHPGTPTCATRYARVPHEGAPSLAPTRYVCWVKCRQVR
jgi:hypothetical protein